MPLPLKGQDNNILLRRPPVPHPSSSQEGLSELVSDQVARGKISSSGASDGIDISKSSYTFLLLVKLINNMIIFLNFQGEDENLG